MQVNGELRQWHKITLDFQGPSAGESASTFRDCRLNVTFTNAQTGTKVTVPGFFAADDDAEDSNASSGNVWRAHFNRPEAGSWSWKASFRTGDDVAVSLNPSAGSPVAGIDGQTGAFSVSGKYDDGSVFLKSGIGSPENLLAYSRLRRHAGDARLRPHAGDWRSGDPTWDGGKGKGIIGAVNYLADQDVNMRARTGGRPARPARRVRADAPAS